MRAARPALAPMPFSHAPPGLLPRSPSFVKQDKRNWWRKYGYAPIGWRAYKAHFWLRGIRASTMAACSAYGMQGWCAAASRLSLRTRRGQPRAKLLPVSARRWSVEGAFNAETLRQCATEMLVREPPLRRSSSPVGFPPWRDCSRSRADPAPPRRRLTPLSAPRRSTGPRPAAVPRPAERRRHRQLRC